MACNRADRAGAGGGITGILLLLPDSGDAALNCCPKSTASAMRLADSPSVVLASAAPGASAVNPPVRALGCGVFEAAAGASSALCGLLLLPPPLVLFSAAGLVLGWRLVSRVGCAGSSFSESATSDDPPRLFFGFLDLG